jgi:hypothetical protein
MDAAPSAVLAEVSHLPGYPAWHGMVKAVEPDGDGWLVDLEAKVGPFKQASRVRLVRADVEDGEGSGRARFVRAELDGEEHSQWELEATVDPVSGEGPCTLTFRVASDKSSPLIGMVEPILRSEVERSAHRLRQLLAEAED